MCIRLDVLSAALTPAWGQTHGVRKALLIEGPLLLQQATETGSNAVELCTAEDGSQVRLSGP